VVAANAGVAVSAPRVVVVCCLSLRSGSAAWFCQPIAGRVEGAPALLLVNRPFVVLGGADVWLFVVLDGADVPPQMA
jgi:hypothetical protein